MQHNSLEHGQDRGRHVMTCSHPQVSDPQIIFPSDREWATVLGHSCWFGWFLSFPSAALYSSCPSTPSSHFSLPDPCMYVSPLQFPLPFNCPPTAQLHLCISPRLVSLSVETVSQTHPEHGKLVKPDWLSKKPNRSVTCYSCLHISFCCLSF